MITGLKEYFPMIRSREEVLAEIQNAGNLSSVFNEWNELQQKEFLDFCTGVRGAKILYDSFFKEILNPDATPERLEELLSLILKQTVKILKVLPNDSTRIADESSLVIMDIVVELEDGSIANVEIQKMGYAFPGQRSACYSADLLLRQYKRVKNEKQKNFSYKDIKKVYTIVLFEISTRNFHQFKDLYLHHFQQKSDTGIEVELLQEFTFIALDNFKEIQQNKGIRNKLEAWLTFLCMDTPEDIIQLIETYPEYRKLYEEVYTLCLNTEKVMGMFSKELLELDKNTVQYMIDEMQDEIDAQKKALEKKDIDLKQKDIALEQKDIDLKQKETFLQRQTQVLTQKDSIISKQEQEILTLKKQLKEFIK